MQDEFDKNTNKTDLYINYVCIFVCIIHIRLICIYIL